MVFGVSHFEACISPRKFEVYLNTHSSNIYSNIIQMSKNAIYACTPRKLMYLQVWPFFKAPYL
jgi:hypothetical protein